MKASLPFVVGFLILGAVAGCGSTDSTSPQVAVSTAGNTAQADLPSDDVLKRRLDEVIAFSRERHLSPQVNNAWQIVHGVLAYGDALELSDNGKLVPAVTWILNDGKFKGWHLVPGEKGLESVLEPGEKIGEGHEDQWIGYMSQAGIGLDHPVVVAGRKFKLGDMITQAKWDVRDRMEATWTLMALSTYLPAGEQWQAKDGSQWTVERIAGMEAAQDLGTSACGGSHRMYGLATALARHERDGGKLTGSWQAVNDKIQAAIAAAKRNQQPDGTFSVNYFERPSTSPDMMTRINTTGHTLEFLSVALTREQLAEPWVTRATVSLVSMLEATRDLPLECAGLYHAVHGLRIYRERRFGEVPLTAGR